MQVRYWKLRHVAFQPPPNIWKFPARHLLQLPRTEKVQADQVRGSREICTLKQTQAPHPSLFFLFAKTFRAMKSLHWTCLNRRIELIRSNSAYYISDVTVYIRSRSLSI